MYFLAAKLGLYLATINLSVSPVWPATGLAISLLFLRGNNYWPSVAIGAFLANISTGIAILSVFAITVGNTLEAIVGAYILTWVLKRKEKFAPHTKTFAIVAASMLATLISATIGTLGLSFFNSSPWRIFSNVWFTWWTGDSLGGLIFIPLILGFCKNSFNESAVPKVNWKLLALILFSGVLLCYFLFFRPNGAPYLFFIFPLLLWIASAAGVRGASVATVLFSIVGILSVELGYGVFIHGSNNDNLINLQLFLGSVGICSLVMSDLKREASLKQSATILLYSWLLAGFFFFGFYTRTMNESDEHFKMIVEGVEPMVDAQIKVYFTALQSGKALFDASKEVTKNEWKSFLRSGYFNQTMPGSSGMGVIFRIPKKEVNGFVAQIRKSGMNNFTYHLFPGAKPYIQNSSDAYIATYIEPQQSNERDVGLDIASEPVRKAAADFARETGQPVISDNIQLLEDLEKRSAFLVLYPFYKKGSDSKNAYERKNNHIGWIYSIFHAREFFASVFSTGSFKEISYAIYENKENVHEPLCNSSDYFDLPKSNERSSIIKMGNQSFLFRFKRSTSFYSGQDNFASWLGAITSLISLLLGTFIISLQTVKKRALRLAEKKTEDLKASEELWKFALQGASDGVWDFNKSKNFIKFSKDFKDVLGYQENDIGNTIEDWERLIHPEDLPKHKQMLQEEFEGEGSYNGEFRFLCKDGSYKWFQARGSIVSTDEDGKPIRMVGTITDISARKRVEHELQGQKEKLKSIFEGSSDALMLLNEDGKFFDCNSQTLKLFGFNSKFDLYRTPPFELSSPTQPDGMDSLVKADQVIKDAFIKGVNRIEWTCKRFNGEIFPTEIMLSAFTYEGKKVLQACVRDITDRKSIESALNAQREKLVASAKMSSLGEMAGGIAHEINNPLAIIIGKTTQLKRRLKLNAQIHESHDEKSMDQFLDVLVVIESTAKRIGAIIKGLSAFSRNAENDSMEKILVPLLIQEIVDLSKERFRFHSISLKYDLNGCEKTYVNGRTAQLLQVLVNLLNNAYDAVEFLPEKWVEINTEKTNDICRIKITDSGSGIPPEVMAKMMTPFFSTKSVGKGTGLGLSISKGIIEEHKGRFYYDETCKNTRFVIELPIA